MIKDIKEVIAAAVKDGAVVTNDVRVRDISIYPGREDGNVEYYATITLNQPVNGMIAEGKGDNAIYKKGLTTTITVPFGSVVTSLFDALFDIDDDDTTVMIGDKPKSLTDAALDLTDYKKILLADAEKEALSGDDKPYVSYLHKLVKATKFNVVTREVKKGKTKSLFSLNVKEVEVKRDSIWHDIYGLHGVRAEKIAEALTYCIEANKEAAQNDAADAKADAFNKIMDLYKQNSNAAAVNAALG
jgi:hypothetical protein